LAGVEIREICKFAGDLDFGGLARDERVLENWAWWNGGEQPQLSSLLEDLLSGVDVDGECDHDD
jgi:hypothetical protein